MNKKNIVTTILIIWFLAANLYIVYGVWNDYKINGVGQAYNAGIADTINKLISQADSSQCQPFGVYNNDKKIQLINAQCVSQKAPTQSSSKDSSAK